MARFEVRPDGPFSLALANRYFGGWAAMAGDQQRIVMPFPVEGWGTSAAVVVDQTEDGTVRGEVHLTDPGAQGASEAAWRQALAVLSLDYDGSGFPSVGQRDPVVGRLQAEHGMMRPVCFHSPYEAGASFVIGHRMSMAQSRALRSRLAREHGEAVQVADETFYAFPRPQVLLELSSYGPIGREKMERLHGIAEAALAGRLDRQRLRERPVDEALRELRSLRGVGEFIAQGILLRGAGLVDEVPGDEVTRQAVQQAYALEAPPSYAELVQRAAAWRPYRTWTGVLLHLWLRSSGRPFRPAGRGASAASGRRQQRRA